MKKYPLILVTLLLIISAVTLSAQTVYEEPQFKFDKTKNAALKITDLNENLELRTPGQPITIVKYTLGLTIDGTKKTFDSNGSKIGKKAVEAILSAKEKPTYIDFSNVTFKIEDGNEKEVMKGFTIFLK